MAGTQAYFLLAESTATQETGFSQFCQRHLVYWLSGICRLQLADPDSALRSRPKL